MDTEVKQGRPRNVIIIECMIAIFKLFPTKDQLLLIHGNAFIILDLDLQAVNRIRILNVNSYEFSGRSFDVNLCMHGKMRVSEVKHGGWELETV